MDLYDGECHLCSRPRADTIDHVVPVAWGGADHPANLKPAHRSCNSSKGADRPDRWTWTRPLMWEHGHGANVDGTVKVPFWPHAGVRVFFFAFLLGALLWWAAGLTGLTDARTAAIVIVAVPIAYDVLMLVAWRQSCMKATVRARTDDTIADPDEWFEDAFARR